MGSPDENTPLDERLRDLEEAAFEEFVALTRASLWRLALGMMGEKMHAEDVLQDCYIRAYDCLMDRRWDGKHPHAWMRTVVTRESLRQLKRRRRWQRIRAHLHRERPPPRAPEPNAIPASMRAHLDVLPPMQRVAILLFSLEGASTQDIARTLGKSQGAIEQLLVRARRTLRQRLDS